MNILGIDLLILDFVIIILSIIIIFFSFLKGFINSVLALLTWIGSIFITIYFYKFLSDYISNLLININLLSDFEQFLDIISIIISIPTVFLISLLILKRLRKFLSSDLDKQLIGIVFDKLFGVIYGLLFSYVIFSTILYFTSNSNFDLLNNINSFLLQNSNIMINISEYNNNIINLYIINTSE